MTDKKTVVSYALAAAAGICFVQGLAILTQGKGTDKAWTAQKG